MPASTGDIVIVRTELVPTSLQVINDTMTYNYICGACDLALLDPYQTTCGLRICGHCIRERLNVRDPARCPCDDQQCEDMISFTHEQYKVYPDYPLRKELKKKPVPCRYKRNGCGDAFYEKDLKGHEDDCEYGRVECEFSSLGCLAKLKDKERQPHSLECDYSPRHCSHCGTQGIPAKNMETHIKNDCPEVEVGCPNDCKTPKMLRKNLTDHLVLCPLRPRMCLLEPFKCTFQGSEEELKIHYSSGNNHVEQVNAFVENLTNLHQDKEREYLNYIKTLEEKIKHIEQLRGSDTEKLKKTQKVVANQGQVILTLQASVRQLQAAISSSSSNGASADGLKCLRTEVATLETTRSALQSDVTSMKEQLVAASVKFQEVELRFQVLETASYDGTLLWKIRDYMSRKEDARQSRILSLYSQAFYTSRHGYRMCARIYLNGDGMGSGSHLSLFFVIMRGEYDALLPWPFRSKVSLMLLDQVGKTRHIVDTFRPDPSSSSFQRPTKDMNIASGCPLFVSHAILEAKDSIFLKDDTLFIKIVVESAGPQTV